MSWQIKVFSSSLGQCFVIELGISYINRYDDLMYMTRRTLVCINTRKTSDECHDSYYSVKLHSDSSPQMSFPVVHMGSSDATRKCIEEGRREVLALTPHLGLTLRPVDVTVAHLEVLSPPRKLENWCQVGQTRSTQ